MSNDRPPNSDLSPGKPEKDPILFWVHCPKCDTKIKIRKAKLIGQSVDCPVCQASFIVRAPEGFKLPPTEASPRKPQDVKPQAPAVSPATVRPIPPAPPRPRPRPVLQLPPVAAPAAPKSNKTLVIVAAIAVVVALNLALGFGLLLNSGGSKNLAQSPTKEMGVVGPDADANSGKPVSPAPVASIPSPPPTPTPAPIAQPPSAQPIATTVSPSPAPVAAAPPAAASGRSSTREILDRVGNGIVLISIFDRHGAEVGAGSGFVIDATGRVATNFHVIESAVRATAQFKDGQKSDISGYWLADAPHDLAVVQLSKPPASMAVLSLAKGSDPQQGDDVIAIGHPKGFNFSVTTGIVSAVRSSADLPDETRVGLDAAEDSVWIQTTAPISPGNSGGPLLNSAGQVIGINSWISVGGENLAFAAHVKTLEECLKKMTSSPQPLPPPGSKAGDDGMLAGILQRFVMEYRVYRARLDQALNDTHRAQLERQSPLPKFMEEFYQLAESQRKTSVALKALVAVVELGGLEQPAESRAVVVRTVSRLLEDYRDDEKLGPVSLLTLKLTPEESMDFLQELSEGSKHRMVRGLASFAWAVQLGASARGDKAIESRAVAKLKEVKQEFGDITLGAVSLGEALEPLLYEFENLAVGKRAPNFKGHDFQQREISLADYKGKVVILDFFSDASPASQSMYDQWRALNQAAQGAPIQIVSVNVDPFPIGQSVVAMRQMTWPVIADGPKGPIGRQFNATSFPKNFVIDRKGVIRYRDVSGPELLEAVSTLLAEDPRFRGRNLSYGDTPGRRAPSRTSPRSRYGRPRIPGGFEGPRILEPGQLRELGAPTQPLRPL